MEQSICTQATRYGTDPAETDPGRAAAASRGRHLQRDRGGRKRADGRKAAGLLPYSWLQSVGVQVVIDRPDADAQASIKPKEAAPQSPLSSASG